MNDIIKAKLAQPEPLSRADIADVLLSIAPAGEKRDEKRSVIKKLCQDRNDGETQGHGIWNALEDWPQY